MEQKWIALSFGGWMSSRTHAWDLVFQDGRLLLSTHDGWEGVMEMIPVTLAMSSLEGFVFPLCLFFASFILPAFFPVLHLVLWPAVFPLAWEPWHYAVLLAKEHSPPTLASERPLSLSSFLGQRPHLWPLDPGSHTCLWLLSTISFLTSFTVP